MVGVEKHPCKLRTSMITAIAKAPIPPRISFVLDRIGLVRGTVLASDAELEASDSASASASNWSSWATRALSSEFEWLAGRGHMSGTGKVPGSEE